MTITVKVSHDGEEGTNPIRLLILDEVGSTTEPIYLAAGESLDVAMHGGQRITVVEVYPDPEAAPESTDEPATLTPEGFDASAGN